MAKILLLAFDPEGRKSRQRLFEESGFSVSTAEPRTPAATERAQKDRPDVIAVDCGQLPTLCRQTAVVLRTGAATKAVPIVLFNVAEHDIERTRLEVVGGVVAYDYELTDRIRSAVLTRIANQAAEEAAAQRAADEKLAARRAARAAKRPPKPPKPAKAPKPEKAPKASKPEKAAKAPKPEKAAKAPKPEKAAKASNAKPAAKASKAKPAAKAPKAKPAAKAANAKPAAKAKAAPKAKPGKPPARKQR